MFINELAFGGFQSLTVIARVSGTVPVFLTYMTLVVVLPGFSIPTLIVLQVCVHELSEYTSTFTVVIFPSRGTG